MAKKKSGERRRPKSSQQVYLSIWTCLRLKSVPYIAQQHSELWIRLWHANRCTHQKYPPARLMFTQTWVTACIMIIIPHTLSKIPPSEVSLTLPITLSCSPCRLRPVSSQEWHRDVIIPSRWAGSAASAWARHDRALKSELCDFYLIARHRSTSSL